MALHIVQTTGYHTTVCTIPHRAPDSFRQGEPYRLRLSSELNGDTTWQPMM